MTLDELLNSAKISEIRNERASHYDEKTYFLTEANNYRLRALLVIASGYTEEQDE